MPTVQETVSSLLGDSAQKRIPNLLNEVFDSTPGKVDVIQNSGSQWEAEFLVTGEKTYFGSERKELLTRYVFHVNAVKLKGKEILDKLDTWTFGLDRKFLRGNKYTKSRYKATGYRKLPSALKAISGYMTLFKQFVNQKKPGCVVLNLDPKFIRPSLANRLAQVISKATGYDIHIERRKGTLIACLYRRKLIDSLDPSKIKELKDHERTKELEDQKAIAKANKEVFKQSTFYKAWGSFVDDVFLPMVIGTAVIVGPWIADLFVGFPLFTSIQVAVGLGTWAVVDPEGMGNTMMMLALMNAFND